MMTRPSTTGTRITLPLLASAEREPGAAPTPNWQGWGAVAPLLEPLETLSGSESAEPMEPQGAYSVEPSATITTAPEVAQSVQPGRVELLAPAGGPDAAFAAFHFGADAVYLGLKKFSGRAGADNFTLRKSTRSRL